MKTSWIIAGIVAFLLLFGIGSYNGHVGRDETVTASWSEVVNQYKRRSDLIPNLVNTVQSYAAHERETLEGVTKARASATSFNITPEVLNNPEAFKKFQEAQGQLAQALSRLMVVSERYPDLKANENFKALQSQLEGTENRIAVARKRYIESVQVYNAGVRKFPGSLTASFGGFRSKPNFSVENEAEISNAPKVEFGGAKK